MGSGGPRGLQNRSGPTTSGWVGSIPTRSRHRASRACAALRAWAAFAVALTFAASAAGAQGLRGVVLLPDSTTPAPGILVTASDASGAVLGHAVTGANGRFTLAVTPQGGVMVRALRVGYRPSELGPLTVGAEGGTELRLVLNTNAVRLQAVAVRASDRCGARNDGRSRVADVWEEARKALLLANTSRADAPLVAEWATYDRALDSLNVRVLDQTVSLTRAPSEHPFRSRHADSLAAGGYVTEDDAGVNYYAPDADVLLAESFAATHCFRLVEGPAGGAARIGLRFEPVERDRRRREITGTLWLARESAELRFLEFTFTELPATAEPAEPGGRVAFSRIPDGAWLVTSWWIRMPELERVLPTRSASARVRITGPSLVLRGVKVVGGEVTRVERSGAVVYERAGASLAVRVTVPAGDDQSRGRGASVALLGTDYRATADSSGIARFPLVLPGRYRVAAAAAGDPEPVQAEVEVRGDSTHQVTMRLLTRRADAAALGLAPPRRVSGDVEFTVADSLGRAIAGAEIGAVDAAGKSYRLRSDSAGRAFLTELPLGDMRVEARMPGYYLAYGTVSVAEGRTPAQVLLERMSGGQVLDTMLVEARSDRDRLAAFENRRRAGLASLTVTGDELRRRNSVSSWQALQRAVGVDLLVGPEGVLPVSRRTRTMDLRSDKPCYMRLAIDGVLLPDVPVNLRDRMPPPQEIHGIEVFNGLATIPLEYRSLSGNLVCGLIVVWTR